MPATVSFNQVDAYIPIEATIPRLAIIVTALARLGMSPIGEPSYSRKQMDEELFVTAVISVFPTRVTVSDILDFIDTIP